MGLVVEHRLGLRLHPRRSAHRLREPGGLRRWIPHTDQHARSNRRQSRAGTARRWFDRIRGASPSACRPINRGAGSNFKAQQARLSGACVLIFAGAVRDHAVCRVHRQRSADPDVSYKGEILFPVSGRLSGIKVRRLLRRHRLPDPVHRRRDRANGWMHLAADPLFLQHASTRTIPAGMATTVSASAIPRRRLGPRARRSAMRRLIRSRATRQSATRNWLGLDNQGRDVVARVIYGFRMSVLFGLMLDDRIVGTRS